MLINLDQTTSICHVKPSSPLKSEDFAELSSIIDPYVKQHGILKGLIIESNKFPGWNDMNGFLAHMKFIKNHQAKVKKIALVTDSKAAFFAENIISLFTACKIKHFPSDKLTLAQEWVEV